VWDVQTAQCQHTLKGHSGRVSSVVFSPDGSRVASSSWDLTVRVWDVQTAQCQHTLEGHSGRVSSVVFSPDGSRVASSSDDQTVRVWDVQTGQCQHTLKGHSGTVSSVVFSPDGSLVASSSDDQTVRVWDIATGAELLCHDSHTCDNDIEFGDNSSNILINGQAINIPRHLPRATIATQSFSSNSASDGKVGIIGEWVMSRSQRILWLPPEYRPGSWASKNDALIIGSDNGRITFVYHTDVI
jgi:WD40 repeat protein